MIKAKLQPLVLEVSMIHSSFHLGTHRYYHMEFPHGPQAAQGGSSVCMVPEDRTLTQHAQDLP